jgi:hypothetical protein
MTNLVANDSSSKTQMAEVGAGKAIVEAASVHFRECEAVAEKASLALVGF